MSAPTVDDSFKGAAMKNILLRANPVVVGVVAMFAITFVYVEIQPEYQPVGASGVQAVAVTAHRALAIARVRGPLSAVSVHAGTASLAERHDQRLQLDLRNLLGGVA